MLVAEQFAPKGKKKDPWAIYGDGGFESAGDPSWEEGGTGEYSGTPSWERDDDEEYSGIPSWERY